VIPRECENDACDEETVVGDDGVPRTVWVHGPECDGLVLPAPVNPADVPERSFLAYLMNRPTY
jgi:hypothetical protein